MAEDEEGSQTEYESPQAPPSAARATPRQSFSCALDSTETLLKILRSIELDKNQLCSCSVTERGVKFTLHKLKTMQAKAYIKVGLFQSFSLPGMSCSFSFNLSTFLSCVDVFGDAAHMRLAWRGHGEPIEMLLEREGVVTECRVRTLEPPEQVDIDFRSSPLASRVILDSAHLRNAFAELESSDAERVQVCLSGSVPHLSLSATGDSSSCRVDFVEGSEDVFSEVQCLPGGVENSYNLAVVRPCLKVLAKAKSTNVRVNERGVLSMQHVIPTDEGQTQWVEFLVCALDD